MLLIGTGSLKEDIVPRLMRTALLIGLAVTCHPDAASGQYSWSQYSVSVGLGTGGAGFGVGAYYTAVDPWYDFYYEDPCWDYTYYELYWYDCPRDYDRIYRRRHYSYLSVGFYGYPFSPSYYWPYGYYGYSSHTHFSLGFGLHSLFYPAYGYSTYGYPEYGVVRYSRGRTASVASEFIAYPLTSAMMVAPRS